MTDKYPVSLWLTPAVLSLAQAAYDTRLLDGTLDHHHLSVLADALEEAGCEGERCDGCHNGYCTAGQFDYKASVTDVRPNSQQV